VSLELPVADSETPDSAALAEPAVCLGPRTGAAEALEVVRSAGPRLGYVAVADDGGFRGLVSVASLLQAEARRPVGDLARMPAAVVSGETSAERAAWLAARAGEDTVAVIDGGGGLRGLIPAHRLLALMMREHEVDLARLGGFLRGASRARTASEEAIGRRVWHRLPWLLLGLSGAAVAARIVSAFEGALESTVALAFFLPGIVYMADAVGTQTETLVIRGLSVGVSVSRIFRLEFLTGAVIGVLLSLAIFPLAVLITDDATVAAVVGLSLMTSATCATAVAVALPLLMQRLDLDPAFGSGPLATVVQDILSIAVYLGIAAALVDGA